MPIPQINRNPSNPYLLDRLANKPVLLALTRKNADYISSIINNFSDESRIKAPSKNFDPEKNCSSADGMYCGSMAYWFEEMKNDKTNSNFEKNVLGAVIAIDSFNKTHLESCKDGRKEMCDRICHACSDLNGLMAKLNESFNSKNSEHLISILTREIDAKKQDQKRFNLSFATKFCSYASFFLATKATYSIYDSIVSEYLPEYVREYLGKQVPKSSYKIPTASKGTDPLNLRLEIYEDYSKMIEDILGCLRISNIRINKRELDHIIWYNSKYKLLKSIMRLRDTIKETWFL